MSGPDPDVRHPVPEHPRIGFLKALAEGRPNVSVGPWTYYDDPHGPERFFERNVLHHYEFVGDRLEIGSFCALASGVTFFMNGANHAMSGFSTFPFNIFGHGWEKGFDPATWSAENRGDTMVGNDVWIGSDALILPGARIGSGAVIAARSVVAGEVAPYSVIAGNPARVLRVRYDPETVETLLRVAWWDWPVERITRNLDAIRGADIRRLEAAT